MHMMRYVLLCLLPICAGVTTGPNPSNLANPSRISGDGINWRAHMASVPGQWGDGHDAGRLSIATSSESQMPPMPHPDGEMLPLQGKRISSDIRGSGYDVEYPCVRDGNVSDTEECDPGPVVNGSGCDAKCRVVWGYTCDGQIGQQSICELVSQDVCYWGVFPRCSPQLGGSTGTAMTVIGEGFRHEYEYRARFALSGPGGRPATGDGISEGGPVKFSKGFWMSPTEVRFIVPWFSDVSSTEMHRRAMVAFLVKSKENSNATGNMFLCQNRHSGKHIGYPGFMSSTLLPYTFGARAVILASNVLSDNVVEIDTASGMATPLFDPRSGGMRRPFGLDIGPDGMLYAASGGTRQILRYNTQTGQFLGVFATIKGDPKGIRWREDILYVLDSSGNRVLMYRWHRSKLNPRICEYGMQGEYIGVFTDGTFGPGEYRDSTKQRMPTPLDFPWELRFHSHNASLRLFISSMHSKEVFRFNGINGDFEGIFTSALINMATGFDFSHQVRSPDLYVTGTFAGNAIGRFNGTTGQFKGVIRDPKLEMAAGLVSYGDDVFVASMDSLRQYNMRTGKLVTVVGSTPGMRLGHIALAMQCN